MQQFKDIQEKKAIDHTLQDNVLLQKGFTECMFHVGNASELNPIIRNGLVPVGKSLKRGRQAVFFTAVNPMEHENGLVDGGNSTRSNKTKNCSIQEYLETFLKYFILVQFEAR